MTKTECVGCFDPECTVCTDPATWRGMPSQHHGVLTNRASSKQVEYLVKLGMDRAEAETLSKSKASDAIDRLRNQPTTPTAFASDKQVAFVERLMAERSDWLDNFAQDCFFDDGNMTYAKAIEAARNGKLGKATCSRLIDGLMNVERNAKTDRSGKGELPDGMYRDDEGHIYKVYHTVHGANQQVAKLLVVEPGGGGASFEYQGKAPLRDLTPDHKLSLEDAKAFGVVYGVCCVCGATLTDENSIRNGIGPVCASKF